MIDYNNIYIRKSPITVYLPYILAVKSILGGMKRDFSEAARLISLSYFLPAEGNMKPFWIHITIGFNPIKVGTKSSHRYLLIHYYSILTIHLHQTVILISQTRQSLCNNT